MNPYAKYLHLSKGKGRFNRKRTGDNTPLADSKETEPSHPLKHLLTQPVTQPVTQHEEKTFSPPDSWESRIKPASAKETEDIFSSWTPVERRGRPKKSDLERKKYGLNIRVSKEEHDRVVEFVRKQSKGEPVTTWARAILLDYIKKHEIEEEKRVNKAAA